MVVLTTCSSASVSRPTVERAVDLARPGGHGDARGHDRPGGPGAIDVYRFVEDGKRLLGSNYGSLVPARDIPRIADEVVAADCRSIGL